MDKGENSQANSLPTSFQMVIGETSSNTNNQMVDYMLNPHSIQQQQQQQNQSLLGFLPSNSSLDKLSFADVMQFADFGPKLALNQTKVVSEEDAGGIDPVYFLKFPVLNDKNVDEDDDDDDQEGLMVQQSEEKFKLVVDEEGGKGKSENVVVVERGHEGKNNKRKRPRIKTNEEVESQRMTHIAVERNRRKQMNEHLRVLRSLMPGSYVQRGDQASIIGGAIEFVRELEQLLQCLESQKRRRIYGDNSTPPTRPLGDSSNIQQPPQPQPMPINQNPSSTHNHQPPVLLPLPNEYIEAGIQEEIAESKSCLADVEVKLLGFDAMIKILSRRRPGQLIKAIASLEDMQLSILHTNITTIEQTVLYTFNVKISGETRYTADDIANSIQQIFSFIHAEIAPYDIN